LKAQGHKIIPLNLKECRFAELNEVTWNIFSLDPSAGRLVEAAGEPVTPAIIHIMQQIKKIKQFHTSTLPDTEDLDRLSKLAIFNSRRMELREDWRKLWHHHNLDICLAPTAQSTAVLHDKFGISPYTSFLNCLDVGSAQMQQHMTRTDDCALQYPSCAIPFGKVGGSDSKETFELESNQTGPPCMLSLS
jgi:amidase